MLVTGTNKMQNGERRRLTFSGMRPEATSFEAATERRSQARERLEQLLLRLGQHHGKTESKDYFWHEVPADDVVSFFTGLDEDGLYANARSALPKYLAQFIEKRAEGGSLQLGRSSLTRRPSPAGNHPRSIGLSKQHGGSKNLDFMLKRATVHRTRRSVSPRTSSPKHQRLPVRTPKTRHTGPTTAACASPLTDS